MGGARRSLAALAVIAVALFAATAASAGGPPIVNETDHFANEPDVFVDVNPCDPSQEVEVTSSDTGVIHFSLFADGTVHNAAMGIARTVARAKLRRARAASNHHDHGPRAFRQSLR
jgi:hypothetical protein